MSDIESGALHPLDQLGVSLVGTPEDEDIFKKATALIPNLEKLAYNKLNDLGLLPPDGKFLCLPHHHGNGSTAVYIGNFNVLTESGYHRVLLAIQDEGGRTSLHVHTQPNMPESYIRLGKGVSHLNTLRLDGDLIIGRRRIPMSDEDIIVPPGVPHFVDTEGGTLSYTLIVMGNAGNYPDSSHHTPLIARLPGEDASRIIRAQDIDHRIPLL
ncbi:hypothetical protein HYU95_00290 [Candidatus Daviesbacteria bacterium]|nr:hypothetical protein [Candidatus Daviesbacteria bacterium]